MRLPETGTAFLGYRGLTLVAVVEIINFLVPPPQLERVSSSCAVQKLVFIYFGMHSVHTPTRCARTIRKHFGAGNDGEKL